MIKGKLPTRKTGRMLYQYMHGAWTITYASFCIPINYIYIYIYPMNDRLSYSSK